MDFTLQNCLKTDIKREILVFSAFFSYLKLIFVKLSIEFEGFQAPISTQNVKEVIDWEPLFSWRDAAFSS